MSSVISKDDIIEKIRKVSSIEELETLRLFYLGKKGLLTSEMKSLSSLSADQKKIKGQSLNSLKNFLDSEIKKKKDLFENNLINEKIKNENLDITLPGRDFQSGKIHPISQTIDEMVAIFCEMGFEVAEGPHIETDFNNFTAFFALFD